MNVPEFESFYILWQFSVPFNYQSSWFKILPYLTKKEQIKYRESKKRINSQDKNGNQWNRNQENHRSISKAKTDSLRSIKLMYPSQTDHGETLPHSTHTQITNIMNDRGEITIYSTYIKKIVRKYHQQIYANLN